MRTRVLAIFTIMACLVGVTAAASSTPLKADTARVLDEVPASLHLALERSTPEADQTVADVSKISLWFTQAPQMSGTSIRVVPEGGEPLDAGKAKMNPDDDQLIELALSEPLAAGNYAIHWRAMAQDGHTVRGDFSFTVRAGR